MKVYAQTRNDTRAVVSAALFLFFTALYLFTAAPGFIFDDNPEFIAAAHTLGIPHPPGYSLFVTLSKLFAFLASHQEALAVNFVGAFFGALAVVMVFLLAGALGCGVSTAAVFAFILGASRTLWLQSVQAEVYSPNLFFTALVLYLAVGARPGEFNPRRLLFITAATVVGFLFHYSIALAVPPIILFLALRRSLRFAPSVAFAGAAISFLILTSLLYLPLRSAAQPDIYWESQDTFAGFVAQVRGVQTMRGRDMIPFADKFKFLGDYFVQLSSQFAPLILVALIPGFLALRRRRDSAALLLSFLALNILIFVFWLNYLYSERAVYVVSVFYIPSFMAILLVAAMGVGSIEDFLGGGGRRLALPLIGLAAVLAGVSIAGNHKWTNRNSHTIAVSYAANMLDTAERDGVLFAPIEVESFPVAAFRALRNSRKDLVMYGIHGARAKDVYIIGKMSVPYEDPQRMSGIEAFVLQHRLSQIPIYYTLRRPFEDIPGFVIHADGILYRVNAPPHEIFVETAWDDYVLNDFSFTGKEYDYVTRSVVSKYGMKRAESLLQLQRIEQAINEIDKTIEFNPTSRFIHSSAAGIFLAIGRLDRATAEYEKALKVLPEHVEVSIDTVAIYSNLSYLYGRLGMADKALSMIKEAVKLAPDIAILRINLGKTLWYQNKYDLAVKELEKAVELGVSDASVLNILGVCYEKIGNNALAEENYQKAIKLDPYYPDTFRDAGIFYAYTMRDTAKALPLLKRYTEIEPDAPDSFDIFMNIALMHRGFGEWKQVKEFLKRAMEYQDSAETRKKSLLYVYLGECAQALGENTALAHFRKAVEIDPKNEKALANLGMILTDTPTTADEGVKYLNKFLEINTGSENVVRVESRLKALELMKRK